jgi:hypothetical protein
VNPKVADPSGIEPLNQACATIFQYNACTNKIQLQERAQHVKDVFALPCEDGTVITRDVTVGTTSVERDATDSAYIVVGDIPFPYSNCVKSFDLDLHFSTKLTTAQRKM